METIISGKSAHAKIVLQLIPLVLLVVVFAAFTKTPYASSSHTFGNAQQLVLEAGGHQAIIRQLCFTSDGQEMISIGDDKTIRIWHVSEDGRSPSLKRVIRGEIENGRAGQLFAMDLSPPDADGNQKWLVVGGYLAGSTLQQNAIRVHDYASGQVIALLSGHIDNILAIAFSPSGRWLASAGKDKTVRLWRMSTLQDPKSVWNPIVLTVHTDRITSLAWSKSGDRLAAASYDGTVGLWDTSTLGSGKLRLVSRLKSHAGKVRTVAFHPEGKVLISGGEDKQIRQWQAVDGKSLGVLAHADHQLSALSFSPDGHLIIAGNFTPPIPKHITLFSYPQGKSRLKFGGHGDLVAAAAFHPSGRWIATGGGEHQGILLWDVNNGKILSRLESRGQTIFAVAFSADGRFISWGQQKLFSSTNDRGPLEYRFDLNELRLLPEGLSSTEAIRAKTQIGDLTLSAQGDANPTLDVKRGWRQICTIERSAFDGFWHSAYTLTSDGQDILSGGQNGDLRLYNLDGTTRARLVGHTGMITAIAVSADGHWALSGSNDQTIKLWDLNAALAEGTDEIGPTLSLFTTVDGEWIAWTPEGYFAASPKGSQLIGYSINQGLDKVAQFVSVDQLFDRFYRPDLVEAKLNGDPEKLWQQISAKATVNEVLSAGIAPRVSFVYPATNRTFDLQKINVKANIIDQGGGVGKVVWKVNGTTVAADSTMERTSGSRLAAKPAGSSKKSMLVVDRQFDLLPGDNKIELIAYNQQDEIASAPAFVTITANQPKTNYPPPAPTLSQAPAVHSSERVAEEQRTSSTEASVPSSSTVTVALSQKTPSESTMTASAPQPSPQAINQMPKQPSVAEMPTTVASLAGTTLLAARIKRDILTYPALHMMVVGINNYRDRSLALKYAVQDGRSIAESISQAGALLFSSINVTLLFDDQVTMQGLERTFDQIRPNVAANDVFLFYLAGHGVTLDGRYYFLPFDFRYTNDDSVRQNAINQDHLQNWLAGIEARKSIVLIDTCESGSFSTAMIAMRGMAEKAAIAKLTRATGRATIVASSSEQPAAEGYQGHGVFTYVLLEGMRHADDSFGNHDGYIGLFELAAYVNDKVPAITMQAFNFEQVPQVLMVGSDFPIGVAGMAGS